MKSFCINPECVYNQVEAPDDMHSIDVQEGDMDVRRVNRHIYSDLKGGIMTLCAVCHRAVQIAKGGL